MSTETTQPNDKPTDMGGTIAVPSQTGKGTGEQFRGTGRRKTSIGRVRIKRGSGKFTVNGRPMESFFTQERDRGAILSVLNSTGNEGKLDVEAYVEGGGFTGQAGAVVLGLARALHKMDTAFDDALRNGAFLTRDARMKERKKYGRRGARRSFQFSKR